MNLPDDVRLDYIVSHEAWYADSVRATNGGRPELNIRAADPEGGCAWEFMVQEHDFGSGRTAVRLMMFGDAFDALEHIPEFFDVMREQAPTTLDAVRRILDKLGAVDSTERTSPYTPRLRVGDTIDKAAQIDALPVGTVVRTAVTSGGRVIENRGLHWYAAADPTPIPRNAVLGAHILDVPAT